jgi:hypothetical protein
MLRFVAVPQGYHQTAPSSLTGFEPRFSNLPGLRARPPKGPRNLKKSVKEPHFVLLGGSHMHKTAPHLRSLGATVKGRSVAGWFSNTVSGQDLLSRVRNAELPPDAVFLVTAMGPLNRMMSVARFP